MICTIIVPFANGNQPSHPHLGTHNNNNMTLCTQGCPRRIQQSLSPAAPTTTLTQPEETALDSSLEQMVLRITNEYRLDSTSTIYDAKVTNIFNTALVFIPPIRMPRS
jgi:hypothetical protein